MTASTWKLPFALDAATVGLCLAFFPALWECTVSWPERGTGLNTQRCVLTAGMGGGVMDDVA